MQRVDVRHMQMAVSGATVISGVDQAERSRTGAVATVIAAVAGIRGAAVGDMASISDRTIFAIEELREVDVVFVAATIVAAVVVLGRFGFVSSLVGGFLGFFGGAMRVAEDQLLGLMGRDFGAVLGVTLGNGRQFRKVLLHVGSLIGGVCDRVLVA